MGFENKICRLRDKVTLNTKYLNKFEVTNRAYEDVGQRIGVGFFTFVPENHPSHRQIQEN